MGYSLTRIPFFTDDIAICPHTATRAEHIGRNITIREFAAGRPVYFELIEETGEYIVTAAHRGGVGEFIHGPEVAP